MQTQKLWGQTFHPSSETKGLSLGTGTSLQVTRGFARDFLVPFRQVVFGSPMMTFTKDAHEFHQDHRCHLLHHHRHGRRHHRHRHLHYHHHHRSRNRHRHYHPIIQTSPRTTKRHPHTGMLQLIHKTDNNRRFHQSFAQDFESLVNAWIFSSLAFELRMSKCDDRSPINPPPQKTFSIVFHIYDFHMIPIITIRRHKHVYWNDSVLTMSGRDVNKKDLSTAGWLMLESHSRTCVV